MALTKDELDSILGAVKRTVETTIDAKAAAADAQQMARRFVPGDNPANTPPLGPASDDKSMQFKSLGEQLQAIAMVTTGRGTDRRLQFEGKAATGLGEAVGSEGGFLVQTDFAAQILERTYSSGQILRLVNRTPISAGSNGLTLNALDETSRAAGSRWGGLRGYWASEAGTVTASRPKWRQMELSLKKLMCLYYATDELLADAGALEAEVAKYVPQEFAFLAEDAIINGDGAGKPLGILTTGKYISVAAESNQVAATIVSENVSKMWSRLWAPSRPNSVWLICQDAEVQLDYMTMAAGVAGIPTYMPPGGLSEASYGRLKGRPVIVTEYNAALGSVGDIALIDFSQYKLIDKGGIEGASSIHVQFLYGEQVFRWTWRLDGQPIWNSALTPANGGNTVHVAVALAARA